MKKVLIIEDEKFLRELITRKLNQEKFEVSEAVDGEEGLKKMKEGKPDIVLLDLIIPKIEGFTLLAKVKKDPSLKSIPVIILSNLGQREDVEKGTNLGAADYIVKANFTPDMIVKKIREILKD